MPTPSPMANELSDLFGGGDGVFVFVTEAVTALSLDVVGVAVVVVPVDTIAPGLKTVSKTGIEDQELVSEQQSVWSSEQQ